MALGRITDYNKTLPIVELYRCVQSEGSRFGRPTIAVRTTGCTHRCYFGEGGWCDSWYTSIHPEKGTFNFQSQFVQQVVLTDVTLVKVVGVILGIQVSIQKKVHLLLMTLSKFMTRIHTLVK